MQQRAVHLCKLLLSCVTPKVGTLTTGANGFPLIRLGDVLLMLAEAYNENGETDKAIIEVNKIRTRVGMPGLNSGAVWLSVNGKEAMTQRIRDERAYELTREGQRYWDIRLLPKCL